MAQEMTGGWCANCNANRMFVQNVQGPNHALHFLLTILLCGCWAWVWLLLTISGPKRSLGICSQCGMPWGYNPPHPVATQAPFAVQAPFASQAPTIQRPPAPLPVSKESKPTPKPVELNFEGANFNLDEHSPKSSALRAMTARFNSWINGLEKEQRIAMIAAPGFIVVCLAVLSVAIYLIRG